MVYFFFLNESFFNYVGYKLIWLNSFKLWIIMIFRLAFKIYKYVLFYFFFDDILEAVKTSKIVFGKANIKEGNMVEVNWDVVYSKIFVKIIVLVSK